MRRWGRGARAVVAAGGVLVLLLPAVAHWLARPTTVHRRTVTPQWRVSAAFVRPGQLVRLPVPARIRTLAPGGLVPAGAALARYQPIPARGGTGWRVAPLGHPRVGVVGLSAATSPWRRTLWSGLCLRRRCAVAAPPAAAALARLTLRAGRSGWFTPGWDPLALVPVAAYSDLPPQALRDAVQALAAAGQVVPAGAPIGILGPSWSGVWLCDLPAGARSAVARDGTASITWAGGTARVRLLAEGPTVAGHFLASFATRSGGADPGPAQRGRVRVQLPAVRGLALPGSALHRGTVVVLGPRGPYRVAVRVRVRMRRLVLVRGVAPGSRVLLRPWVLLPWLAGSGAGGGK